MDKALQTMITNMPEKTGKSLEEWKKILKKKNFAKHGEAMKFLKGEHAVTHGFANTIITLSKEDQAEGDDLVLQQYEKKQDLIPIYEALIKEVGKFGKDVKVVPKKTSVSIIRAKQFALIKPATKTRIDLGLKLKGVAVSGRLQDSGPFGSMCTHRICIESKKEVDKEVKAWLLKAYEMSI